MGVGIAAAAGIAAATAAITAAVRARKSALEKKHEEELDKLLQKQRTTGLGLTPQEQRLREQQLIAPVQQAAEAGRARGEAIGAATGQTSGADISRLRQEQARVIGTGAQRAQQAITTEDIASQRAGQAHIAALEAAVQEGKFRRQEAKLEAISEAGAAAGSIAGGSPETFRAAGLAGAPIRDQAALVQRLKEVGVDDEGIRIIQNIPPEQLSRVLNNVLEGNIAGPQEEALLHGLLRSQAANVDLSQFQTTTAPTGVLA